MKALLSTAALWLGACAVSPSVDLQSEALVSKGNAEDQRMMRGPWLSHLGQMIFFDSALSLNENQSCATCHAVSVGWTGPDDDINRGGGVYEGSVSGRFGNRKPPSAAYAASSPVFTLTDQGFTGGNFVDGRATGWDLGDPAADQARGPFLNPVEQALPDAATLLDRVCAAHYAHMLTRLFGAEACRDPMLGYAAVARSLAAFEASSAVSAYASKYDAAQAGQEALNEQEQRGLALFNGKAQCSQCHASVSQGGAPAVFSDFGFDNIGVPKNPQNPFYTQSPQINAKGRAYVDRGLAGFLEQLAADDAWRSAPHVPEAMLELSSDELMQHARDNAGKHRVPTLRNVERRPDAGFVKAYTHNGYFKSLQSLVHFYNTRDVLPRCQGDVTEDVALANDCWPAAEVADNLDARVGDLGLSQDEESALVAFLSTLSDRGAGPRGGMMPGQRGMCAGCERGR